MSNVSDKNGIKIQAGDVIYNPNDIDAHHTVIADDNGNLFIGDYDSPIENYCVYEFWTIEKGGKDE